MKQRFELEAELRETGKHNSRALRKQRKVPAVIYGAVKNQNLFLNEGDIIRYNSRKYDNALFNLKSSVKDVNGKIALLKSVDVHPLTRKPLHVDLYALDLTKPVRIFIEVKAEGKAIGLSEGGLLNIVNRELEIEVLPNDIPENIVVDVTHLGVGDSVHVSELKLPNGVKMISSPELTVAVVNLIEEETAAPVAAAAAATPAAATPAKDAKAAPAKDAKTPAAKAPAKK